MSNAMSRSKSRWKGVLLATVATAVVSPMVVKAQSMTVGLYLSPLGTSPAKTEYIDPTDTVPLYVYATVTGTSAPSASYVDGLQYLYFNVNASVASGATGLGTISAANLSSNFGGGYFNGSIGVQGAQLGNVSNAAYTSTSAVAVGSSNTSTAAYSLYAKPRAANPVYVNSTAGSGSNIIVNGNSVSYLVETLYYTPNTTAVNASPSAVGSPNTVAFNVSVPSLATNYAGSNYFVGLPSTPTTQTEVGAANTSTGYSATATTVSLINALPGDVNLDGTVNATDLNIIASHFNTNTTGYTNGDLNNDGLVNATDLNVLAAHFNTQLGAAPSGIASPSFAVALADAFPGGVPTSSVPEPTSLGLVLLGGSALARRRSRR